MAGRERDVSNDGPSHFYKYRSLEGDAKERTRRTITDNTIWFSRPETFNDLFDCAPDFSMAAPAPAFQRYVMRLFRDKGPPMNRAELRAQIADIRRDPARQQNSPVFLETMRRQTWKTVNEAGVLSLSTRRDQVLMWSHYAASHTGICLRFSGASWAFPFRAAQPVIYSAARPILNPVFDDGEAIMSKVVLTKADFWAYEEEWRVMSHPGSPIRPGGGHGLITYEPRALDGIILGARISDADAAEVAGWVRGREQPVELLHAVADPHQFRFDIVPFSAGR